MNNKTPMDQTNAMRNLNRLLQETQEEDFLLGKKPSEFQISWEDEE